MLGSKWGIWVFKQVCYRIPSGKDETSKLYQIVMDYGKGEWDQGVADSKELGIDHKLPIWMDQDGMQI